MHVAFICNEYPPGPHGGIGTFTRTLARRLVADGHRVTVVGTYAADGDRADDDGDQAVPDQGVHVIRLLSTSRLPGWRAIADQRRLWRRLAQVHAHDPIDVVEGAEPSLWAAPRNPGYPAIVRIHGGHRFFAEAEGRTTAPARSWVESRSLRRADDLVAVSAFVAERTRSLLDLGDRPITVIPNGVDVDAFCPDAGPAGPGTVVFVGTVCEKKGVRQLVEGFPAVVAAVPGARLLVAGRDQVDPLNGGSFTERLRASVAPPIAERIEFLGQVDHDAIGDLIARAEVCALPSHMEAQGLVWLEVLASGRALVASTAGPGPEVVEDGVSGVLVDPRDPAAIAGAIVALLTDAERRRRLAEGARARAVERFSLDELAAVNVEHYRSVAERWRATRG
ncbi:MAG: glycosyltransferase family 4 protein [Acidimicrobiales bacterium]